MKRNVLLFMLMHMSIGFVSSLQNGEGVCNRTEIRNITRLVPTEVVVGTTIVPCIANSWIDELSCGNRKQKTKNVTEVRQTKEIVKKLVIRQFCCEGYDQVNDRCVMAKTTRQSTSTTSTTSTTVKTTSVIPETSQTTHRIQEITTERVETQSSTLTNVRSTHMDTATIQKNSSEFDNNKDIKKKNQNYPDDSFIVPESKTSSEVIPSILLYICAACGLVSVVVMIVVIGYCYHKNRRNKNRSPNQVLTMDNIQMERNSRMFNPQTGCEVQNQNAKNVYKELHMSGSYEYDDIKGIEENPYDELPDEYQDCDASPRMSKTSQDNYYDVSKF